ncbi:MAG: LytTR family DNA-binding domain-containing protein [Lachnospiraceae bacterium]
MIKIAICDDEIDICTKIENILLEHAAKLCRKAYVEIFYSGESLTKYIALGNTFDLVFLDIEMGEMNGVEVGKYIRKVLQNHTTQIVYVSARNEYDRQLFDVQPLHFIPKPITYEAVVSDLELALSRMGSVNQYFVYKKGKESYKIPMRDIIYFESFNREIKIIHTNGEDTFYDTLEDVTQSVRDFSFLRIHRSYLINEEHTRKFKFNEVLMSNGMYIPISRTKRQVIRAIQMDNA